MSKKPKPGLITKSYSLGIKNDNVDGFISYDDFKLLCEALSCELPRKTLLTFSKTTAAYFCCFDCHDASVAKQWTISVIARLMLEFDNQRTSILFGN